MWGDTTNIFGNIFPTLHIATVIMHCVIVVIVFYRIPRKCFFPDHETLFVSSS